MTYVDRKNDFLRLFTVFFTVCAMSERKAVKTWAKTRVQFLLKHKSGRYYCRVHAGGKEHWRNLQTEHFQVAQARLADAVAEIRGGVAKSAGTRLRRMTFKDAADLFMENPTRDSDAKASTVTYWQEIVASILASWPEVAPMDVRKIKTSQVREWSDRFAAKYSASRYNSALSAMRNIFKRAIREGVRYDNPAEDDEITRRKVRAKMPSLPPADRFGEFVTEIEGAGGRFSSDCADFVRGLAYTGLRRGEAKWLLWRHLDFKTGRIRVTGGADGTKNHEERFVPMIADARTLFERMRKGRGEEGKDSPVFLVNEAQKAIDRAAMRVGIDRITHHDLRHLFATQCIESGVDIPTLSRWLGHKDGGVLAMKTYGHLRDEHSERQAKLVSFAADEDSREGEDGP